MKMMKKDVKSVKYLSDGKAYHVLVVDTNLGIIQEIRNIKLRNI